VGNWYDEAYLPVLATIREQNILRDFPGRTEADLYLWISDHQLALRQELGWRVRPEVAALNLPRSPADVSISDSRLQRLLNSVRFRILDLLTRRHKPSISRWHREKLVTRYSASLFKDLLVPLSGDGAGWTAFEQAAVIARHECATVHGLLVLENVAAKQSAGAAAIQATFESRCREAGVDCHLSLDVGRPATVVATRSPLVDLVVLDRHIGNLGATCQTVVRRCVRPVLIVAETPSAMERPLLVLDSSAGTREALFVAAYLAELWQRPLLVLANGARSQVLEQTVAYTRRYLQMHEVEATFITTGRATSAVLLETAAAHDNDLIIAAGGSLQSRTAAFLRRPNPLLTRANVPLLICG
jgi:hypothetical protein